MQLNTSNDAINGDPTVRKTQTIELGVFLFLILSWIGSSFFVITGQVHLHFIGAAVSSIVSDLSLLCLVLYLVWRNGESFRRIGWTRTKWGGEIGWGMVLFLPAVIGANALEQALRALGLSAPSKLPSFLSATGVGGIILACVLVVVVAVVEETVFRGYLILRIRTVTRRTSLAVVLSSVVFSLGHGYEGTAGVISVFVLGVVFALIYVWRKSLIAPMVMHFLTDFTSIVLVAFLRSQ
ncbi:MAG: CPBP family intramembrane metalloprotease [Candidatus Omnitrophica bacterium]|nr:CPBP family intramembrane metalloprotease [Candidatus Omnitrophota bacterium]